VEALSMEAGRAHDHAVISAAHWAITAGHGAAACRRWGVTRRPDLLQRDLRCGRGPTGGGAPWLATAPNRRRHCGRQSDGAAESPQPADAWRSAVLTTTACSREPKSRWQDCQWHLMRAGAALGGWRPGLRQTLSAAWTHVAGAGTPPRCRAAAAATRHAGRRARRGGCWR